MTSHSGSGDATSSITQREEITRQIQSVLSTSDCLAPSKDYYARSTGQAPANAARASSGSDLNRMYKVKLAKLQEIAPPGFTEILVFSRSHPVVWSNAALVLLLLVVSFFSGGGPLPTPVLLGGLLVLGTIDYVLCRWYLHHKRRLTYNPHRENWGKGILLPKAAQTNKDSRFLRNINSSLNSSPSPSPTPWIIIKRNHTHPVVWMNAILLLLTALAYRTLWHRPLFAQLVFLVGLGFGSMLNYDITMKWLRARPYKQGSVRNWLGYDVIW